jgi:phage N-6-adenine-methyltransferase
MSNELITKEFAIQCREFPARVDMILASIETVGEAKDMLDKAAAMKHYAERLKGGIEIEKPIAIGVLKIKAKIGELCPAKPAAERGQGRGEKESILSDGNDLPFDKNTITAYRKIAANIDQLDDFCAEIDDVPTQGGFLKYVQDPHVKNNSGENEWYTPPEYIEAARSAMGGIDLDPATSEKAQQTVKAKKFYTADDDGLSKAWKGRVWLNPPYSKDLIGKFCDKLAESVEGGKVTAAILLVNNATDTAWFHRVAGKASAVCFVKGRISFHDVNGDPKGKPLQGQMAMYFGGDPQVFAKEFGGLGECFFGGWQSGGFQALRGIIDALDEGEAAVVRDWITERLH